MSENKVRMAYIFGSMLVATLMLGVSIGWMIAADPPESAPPTVIDWEGLEAYKVNGIRYANPDNADSIQDTLNELPGKGYVVVVPPGQYVLSAGIYVPNGTILYMAGAYITRPAETTFNLLQVTDSSDVHIYGGTFDGADSQVTSKGTGETTQCNIVFRNSENCSVRDATVKNATQNGIYLWNTCKHIIIDGNHVFDNRRSNILLFSHSATLYIGPHHCIISNNVVEDYVGYSRPGIYLSGGLIHDCQYNVIVGNIVRGVGSGGINLVGASNNTVTGNTITNCGSYGIELIDGSTNNTISSNIIDGMNITDYGIDIHSNTGAFWDCTHNVLVGNVIHGTTLGAIYVKAPFTTITSNSITYNYNWGIRLFGASYTVVLGNVITNNGLYVNHYGVIIEAGTMYSHITNNIIVPNQVVVTQLKAIQEYDTSDYNIIRDNTVAGNNDYCIVKVGAHTIVRSNIGYVTEAKGIMTVTGAYTDVSANPGLIASPTLVLVTCNNTGAGAFVVTNAVWNQITVSFENAPGTDEWKFYWYAEV